MKRRTREEEAAYKREYRQRVLPVVPPSINVPPCPTKDVLPVLPCRGCEDRDTANKILRAKLLMAEKELTLLRRDRQAMQDAKKDMPRNVVLRPGSHPAELYGA